MGEGGGGGGEGGGGRLTSVNGGGTYFERDRAEHGVFTVNSNGKSGEVGRGGGVS